MPKRGVFLGLLALLAVSVHAADEERRLDTRLKLVQRAQRGAVDLRSGRALELVSRLGPRRGLAVEDAPLLLLVKYPGDRARLEAAGFRIQSQMGSIYTGALLAEHLSDLLKLSDLHFAQLSQELHAPPTPQRERSRVAKSVRGAPAFTPAPLATPGGPTPTSLALGQGVLVGFVDTGVDVCHQDFRNSDAPQTTRIKYLLDFSDPGDPDADGTLNGTGPFGGTLYVEADINSSLQTAGFCTGSASATVNEKDTTGHGTHGLSIAAGDDPALPGLAPGADLIVVKATREGGSLSFQSVDIINALSFIDQKAAELDKPYVVNLSLGTIFASHDGRSLEEQALDALVGPGIRGKVAVVAAGNSSENRSSRYHHFQGTGYVGITRTHTLTVPSYTANPGTGDDRILLDVWYEGRDKHTLMVTAPDGTTTVTAVYGDYADVATPSGDVFIANMGGANPLNGDTEALVLIDDFSGTAPASGTWTIALVGEEIGDTGRYDGWLTDDSALGTTTPYLSANADNLLLVGKPGGAYNAITVGAFGRHDLATRYRTSWLDVGGISRTDTTAINGDISGFSSTGKTRDGRIKPELTAPGERNLGAVSKDAYPGTSADSVYRFHDFPEIDALITENTVNHRFGVLQGTSFSAPVVTGLAARVLDTNPDLDAIQVRNVLLNAALVDGFVTAAGAVPNPLWGYGKADLGVGPPPLPSDLRITVDTLPAGVVGEVYNFVLTASGGTLPYSWFVTSGWLPPGLTLENGGFLTGTPTTASTYPITIQVTDSSGSPQVASRSLLITVSATAALRIETTTLPVAHIDQPYEHQLEATGGSGAYTWSFAGGSLPSGLSLLGDGLLQGTPPGLTIANFTVQVQDGSSTALRSYQLKVLGPGGEDWTVLGRTAPYVNEIVIDPNDSSHLMVSTQGVNAVFESMDAGLSWNPVSINKSLNNWAIHLAFSPLGSTPWAVWEVTDANPNIRWAIGRFDRGAQDWVSAFPCTVVKQKFSQIAFGSSDEPFVLQNSEDCSGSPDARNHLLKFSADGTSWSLLSTLPGGQPWGWGDRNRAFLSIAKSQPSSIYAGRPGGVPFVDLSIDDGATWNDIANGSTGHADIQVSALDPLDVVKLAGYPRDGVERSTDGGRNWAYVPLSSTGSKCCLRRSESSPGTLALGTDTGLYRSTNSGTTWSLVSNDALGAPITAVGIDPQDAQSLFAASQQGLFASTDGGQSWRPKSQGLVRRIVGDLRVSASEPTTVAISAAEGPYISLTSGDRWTLSASGVAAPSPSKIAIAPLAPDRLWVGSNDGVYFSSNRGVSWFFWLDPTSGAGDRVLALDADPSDPLTAIVGLSGTKGLYRTIDGGPNWVGVSLGVPFTEPMDLSFARDVAGRVYASFTSNGVYRSENKGTSWTAFGLAGQTVSSVEPAPTNSEYVYASVGSTIHRRPGSGSFVAATTNPAHPVLCLAVDATTTQIAYAGIDHPGTGGETGGVYKTTDGGATWNRLAGILDSFDVVSLAAHPTVSGTLWAATYNGGVYRTTDGGGSWTELGDYGTIADLTNVNVQDPSNPFLLFAGTEGYGVQASVDKGRTYVPRVNGLTNFNINALTFDSDTPSRIYAGSDNGVFLSTDSGNTWSLTAQGSGDITGIVTDNLGSVKRVWATVVGEGVAASVDGGTTFTVYSTGLDSLQLTSITLENLGSIKRVWATMLGGSGVAYSDDGGQTWVSAAGNGLTDRDINDLAVETGSVKRVWATAKSGVFFSGDAGLSWTELSLGLPSGVPLTSVSIDPNTSEVLVSAFSQDGGGVYRGGSVSGIWTPFNGGLGELRVKRLTNDRGHAIDATTNGTTFYASTSGDGVYVTEIRTVAGQAPSVTSVSLPNGILRDPYSASFSAQGGTPPYAWSIRQGALPSGLVLDGATGAIRGQPGQTGIYGFTVQVSDQNARTGGKVFAIEVLDASAPRLSLADLSVTEGNSGTTNAVFTVSLSAVATEAVGVSYATSDGSAAAGGDYVAKTGSLTIVTGQTSATLTVLVNGDTTPEGEETFYVNLLSASHAGITDAQAVATITNDDAFPNPSLTIGDVQVVEANSGTKTAVFTVSLSPSAGAPVTVNYATANGTAQAGSDYTAKGGALAFPAGVTTATLSVSITGDLLNEADETFLVNLSGASGGAATIADGQGQGTILNDDPVPHLSIGNCGVNEGDSATTPCTFTATLRAASGQPISVDYQTMDGTATAGADYQATSGTLSFAAGITSRSVSISIMGDTRDEPNETFLVNLFNPTNVDLSDAQGLGAIADDDPTPLVSIGDASVTEGNSGATAASFAVTLSAASDKQVTVQYYTTDGSATDPADYAAAAGTLTFQPGWSTQTIAVSVKGDTLTEVDELFFVNLANPGNANLADASAVGTIVEDDLPRLSFSAASYVIKESVPTLTVTVKRSGVTTGTHEVTYRTSDGSAQAGSDYSTTSGVLTFTPGLVSKTFMVPIVNDGGAEGNEAFLVSLANPMGGAILAAPSTAVVTLSDNDLGGTIQFNAASSSVSEKVGTAKVVVSRTGGTALGVTVDWAISGGTAIAGTDYQGATSGTLTFGANVASQTISIPITDDSLAEGNETLALTLSNPMGGAALGGRTTHTLALTDDETALTFSAVSYAASEAAGKVTLTVKRTGATGSAAEVAYATSNGSASQPADYAQTTGTLSFAPGVVSRTLSVAIANDGDVEGPETFQVALGGATNGAGIGPNGTATVTIVDSEPGFVFGVAKYTAPETAGKATITVKRTGATSSAASVNYATSNGTATQPDDYASTSGILSFGTGVVTKTFMVPIVNDTLHEDAETLNLTLSSPQGAYLGAPSTATLTITDNDAAAVVQFSGATFGASESGLLATLTLKRTGTLNVPLSIGFTTEDGTGLAGQDYEAATGTVSFAAGETTKTITVNLLDDPTDEPNEALTVKLQHPTGNGVLGPLSTATLWIVDDD